ncbi:MAG TPA: hypothetical protein PLO37_12110 [Candidatus Hydrogenedentes bacterium]|nr:hypothetical protein [Candidatus Hydrogenedentota bacterium]HPG67586.1 hypothetical protein [Candidatus Hydrogenedentota bacterium]
MKGISGFLSVVVLFVFLVGQVDAGATGPERRAPVYFNIIHHEEAVGNPCDGLAGFPLWQSFKNNLYDELALLDSRGIVSDQYFSDFIVSVAQYLELSGQDPTATEIFDWFTNSDQNLGYHFHPTTWDVPIRTDRIAGNASFDGSVSDYAYWEAAYYDWEPCLLSGYGHLCMTCGDLDPLRAGGLQFMEAFFGTETKKTVAECGLMRYAAVGQMFRNTYILPRGRHIVCSQGAPHSFSGSDDGLRKMWTSDLTLASSELFLYVYKMMGLYFVKHISSASIEGRYSPVSFLDQKLDLLPRNTPHFFVIHLVNNTSPGDPLIPLLDYLQTEFIPANVGSRFISLGEIPSLVEENPRSFTMPELEEAATYFLQNYMGRPPAFIRYGEDFMSNASLFKALQFALYAYLSNPSGDEQKSGIWPEHVDVADFIRPPMGNPSDGVSRDLRVPDAMTMATFATAVTGLLLDDSIPYHVTIHLPLPAAPLTVNPAEFLNGMCAMFIRLRNAAAPMQETLQLPMHLTPGYIVPASNIEREAGRDPDASFTALTPLEWFTDLQSWTLEPLRFKYDAPVDSDGDGYFDDEDAFPDNPDEWEDVDEDSLGDNFELFIIDFDPLDEFTALDDVKPGDDFDRDGRTNLEEFLDDSDPTEAPNDLPVTTVAGLTALILSIGLLSVHFRRRSRVV